MQICHWFVTMLIDSSLSSGAAEVPLRRLSLGKSNQMKLASYNFSKKSLHQPSMQGSILYTNRKHQGMGIFKLLNHMWFQILSFVLTWTQPMNFQIFRWLRGHYGYITQRPLPKRMQLCCSGKIFSIESKCDYSASKHSGGDFPTFLSSPTSKLLFLVRPKPFRLKIICSGLTWTLQICANLVICIQGA